MCMVVARYLNSGQRMVSCRVYMIYCMRMRHSVRVRNSMRVRHGIVAANQSGAHCAHDEPIVR